MDNIGWGNAGQPGITLYGDHDTQGHDVSKPPHAQPPIYGCMWVVDANMCLLEALTVSRHMQAVFVVTKREVRKSGDIISR